MGNQRKSFEQKEYFVSRLESTLRILQGADGQFLENEILNNGYYGVFFDILDELLDMIEHLSYGGEVDMMNLNAFMFKLANWHCEMQDRENQQ